MFFAKIGQYEPCGLFNPSHFIILSITVLLIGLAVWRTKNKSKSKIKNIIKGIVLSLWALEFLRIGYKLWCGDLMFLESYMPLFFCSIFLYSGLLSAFGKGKLQRAGDVALSTGALFGGLVFLIFPSTSLPDYPVWHFVSVHSFLYHGCMVYVGLIMLITGYINLKKTDIFSYSVSVLAISVVAFLVNIAFDCNLMFISKGFPGELGKILYNILGPLYTPVVILGHIILPYYTVYGIFKQNKKEL